MKHVDARLAGVLVAAIGLSGCVGPLGPTIPVMPAPGKPFAAFQNDQAVCQSYANQETAPLAAQANNQAVGSALIGTALGAGLGAAVGGGRGAAIGAASGAVVGTGVGASNAQLSGMSLQQQYNVYYAQCMSSKGNRVPNPGYGPPSPYSGGPPPGYGPSPYDGGPPPGYGPSPYGGPPPY